MRQRNKDNSLKKTRLIPALAVALSAAHGAEPDEPDATPESPEEAGSTDWSYQLYFDGGYAASSTEPGNGT